MKPLQQKKLLVIGGSASMMDLVKTARRMGVYTIVTDWNSVTDSPAKSCSDAYWDISIMDYDALEERAVAEHIDGVITCMTDSYLTPYRILCERLGLPCYLNKDTEAISTNKLLFKKSCADFGIPVAKRYEIDEENPASVETLPYPVIVKPADGSGSRGFKVCHNGSELLQGYEVAKKFSASGQVIVEDYIPYDSTIIHYTFVDGKCYYSGMSDKISCSFQSSGSSVMGLQVFPSKGEKVYLETLDQKVRQMFPSLGFKNGPVWIEAFYDGGDKFIFNEMGYRFGGSFTYYPVQWLYGFSQLEMLLNFAIGNDISQTLPCRVETEKKYCILPVHCKPGKIEKVEGEKDVMERSDVFAYAPKHFVGQEIKEWGTALQAFCYLHLLFENKESLMESIKSILDCLKAYDAEGNNLLYTLFDVDNIKTMAI